MKIAYGYRVTSDDDLFLKLARSASDAITQCGSAGGTPVDFFPFLKHMPSWFPGTHYANVARSKRKVIEDFHRVPFQYAQDQLAKGTTATSLVALELEERERLGPRYQSSDEDIMGVGTAMYIAGAKTTWSSISTFIYVMLLHPECQARAQQEIDSIVGSDRLPEFEDRNSLPWHGAAPLGVPHRCMEDDIYRGMWIPKGSIIIANIRAINLDEIVYAEPHAFNPSRFLPQPEGNGEPYASETRHLDLDEGTLTLRRSVELSCADHSYFFRICPGRHLAHASVWIAMASILAAFDIKRAVRDDGSEIIPDADAPFRTGLASLKVTLPILSVVSYLAVKGLGY
ncbi:hypothetical protein H0H92_005570 [Tricholoma furcatifolium]|nr:hypothetical protein H0H92_005570 [Tricholoma furcatifolium]